MNIPAMLREGYESYRRYVNPLVTLRAELLGEPTRITAVHETPGLSASILTLMGDPGGGDLE